MKNDSTNKIIISDKSSGSDLYLIQIRELDYGVVWVDTSTGIELPNAGVYDLEIQDMQQIIEEVVSLINLSEAPVYFSNDLLDKRGKYCESYAIVRSQVISEKIMNYDCVSSSRNAYLLHFFESIGQNLTVENEINRKEFEKYLTTDLLKNEYINNYCQDNKFYREKTIEGEIYIFAIEKTLNLMIRIK